MHEMSLMEGMLQVIEESARAQGYQRVHGVVLEVGRLSGAEVEALRFAFEVVTEGTVAAGARLEIEEPPGQGWCAQCERVVEVEARFDPCPLCGTFPVSITGGTQMLVKALDVT